MLADWLLLNREKEAANPVVRIIEGRSVLILKLTVFQLMKKLHNFCRTRRFITVFTRTWTGLYHEPDVSSSYSLSCCISYGIYVEEA